MLRLRGRAARQGARRYTPLSTAAPEEPIDAFASAILADNPLGFWPLQETSGTNANDLGSGNNDGTYSATIEIAQAQSPFVGGVSVYINNGGDYVDLGSGTVATTIGDFTVGALIRPGNVTGYNPIFSWGTNGDEFFFGHRDRKIVLYSTDLVPTEQLGTTVMSANTWYFIVFKRSGADWVCFLNGASDGSGTWVSTSISLAGTMRRLGGDNSEYMLGHGSHCFFFNSAIADARIQAWDAEIP